jgi:hypothetical protein
LPLMSERIFLEDRVDPEPLVVHAISLSNPSTQVPFTTFYFGLLKRIAFLPLSVQPHLFRSSVLYPFCRCPSLQRWESTLYS